ncbi:Endo/exonuclease/phosphatase domain-containing protein [Aphis craccivora]|uniref:Endo/exonuclease/phosphatase domain-containing protein n=1 Tax=Aphis craccivora TaxID=307492 RepID=A0A6G0YF82_APHCR|nr:Endo/exonuclease/phosphatase domain-containing protein [Aphis craccivora]
MHLQYYLRDFNSRNTRNQMWGSNHTDLRGKTMDIFLDNYQFILLNTVLNEYNCSDHWPISITLLEQSLKTPYMHWNLKNPNWKLYQDLRNQNILEKIRVMCPNVKYTMEQ